MAWWGRSVKLSNCIGLNRKRYREQVSELAARLGDLECCYKEAVMLRRNWTKEAVINSQHRSTEDDLKIWISTLSTLKTNFTITTLIQLRDQATYVWLTLATIRICTATGCGIIQTVTCSTGQAMFNRHLRSDFLILRTWKYRLPGAEVLEHQGTTIVGVGRRVVARQGSVIFLSIGDRLWRRLELRRSCSTVQEVESWEKTRSERGNLIGGCT